MKFSSNRVTVADTFSKNFKWILQITRLFDITDKDGRDGVSISGEHRMIQTTRRESKESKLRIQYSDNATIKF
jgi:hypothetical protein